MVKLVNRSKIWAIKIKIRHGRNKKSTKKHLLRESREARTNIENLYKARKAAIDFRLIYFNGIRS